MPNIQLRSKSRLAAGVSFPVIPHVCYGFLKLYKPYRGPLVRLRRVSDNAELDFYPSPNGELDSNALTTWIGGSSAKVHTWYDQMDRADLSQSTAADQPNFSLVAFGGRPSVKFERTTATDGTKLVHPGDNLSMDTLVSLCLAYEPNAINVGVQTILTKAGGGAAAGELALHLSAAASDGKLRVDRPNIEAGVDSTSGMAIGTNYMIGVDCQGSGAGQIKHFLNGVANGTDQLANGTNTTRAFQVGAGDFGAGTQQDPCRGYMRALVIWDGDKPSSRQAASAYIAARSSITMGGNA